MTRTSVTAPVTAPVTAHVTAPSGSVWSRYWFAPARHFDLAMVRIIAVLTHLVAFFVFTGGTGTSRFDRLAELASLPKELYSPPMILSLISLDFGAGATPPSLEVVQLMAWLLLVSGILALVGLFTNLSLVVLAFTSVFTQAYLYSWGDFHHPEAVMMVALAALALSPAGRTLSVDAWIRSRRTGEPVADLDSTGPFAGWARKLVMWFFVLMYLSAVVSKLIHGGFGTDQGGIGWANGYTLQAYLLQDGLRWNNPIGIWFAQFHTLILLGQFAVLLFQATFALPVLFPRLRWIYMPVGLGFHISIYILLLAPFFQWIFLYAVFIPWAAAAAWAFGRRRLGAPRATPAE